MVPFYKAMLPKLGFNRHLPKAVRYGPAKYNGKGLAHLAVHQHAKHLEWFVSEIRKESHLGKVLTVQMDKHQMILGTEKHFLSLKSTDIVYSEPSRIQFLWEENTKRGVSIQVANAWRQKPQREGDRAVMDIFREAGYDKNKLEILNDVRLYLHVTYISCMANERGDRIEKWALFGPPHESSLSWPGRRKPIHENLRLWRETVYQTITAANGLYPTNLGPMYQQNLEQPQ